jgi:hypothetical protein
MSTKIFEEISEKQFRRVFPGIGVKGKAIWGGNSLALTGQFFLDSLILLHSRP